MNPKVIAVDFDGTLCYSNWPGLGTPNLPLIEGLIQKKIEGSKIILWTCREGKILEDAVTWCHSYGLDFDAINDNISERIESYGLNPRKIGADLYIDDLSLNPIPFSSFKF